VENYPCQRPTTSASNWSPPHGADGDQLLAAIDAPVEQPWLAQLPVVHVLREGWKAQYVKEDG
jgi:hypothetical protein